MTSNIASFIETRINAVFDRWGRSLVDLVTTLQELAALKVGFVSLSEALDMTTPSGRALAGMLAVFAEFERDILRDRVKAGIAQARKEGRPHGRPQTVYKHVQEVAKTLKEWRQQASNRQTPQYQPQFGPTSPRAKGEVPSLAYNN